MYHKESNLIESKVDFKDNSCSKNEMDNLIYCEKINSGSLSRPVNNYVCYSNTKRLPFKCSNFFDDNKRSIDFVIVVNASFYKYNLKYNNTNINNIEEFFKNENDLNNLLNDITLNERNKQLAEYCREFEKNLKEEGLELEYSLAQHVNTDDLNFCFIKIHAPWKILCKYAEIMKLKMPMKPLKIPLDLFLDENTPKFKGKFTSPYSRDKEYLFDIPSDKRLFFNSAQRSQILEFILKRKSFSSNIENTYAFGIDKLIQDRAYIAAYPLHDGPLDLKKFHKNKVNDIELKERSTELSTSFTFETSYNPRALLFNDWASFLNIFSKQPLDEIKEYFGVKIAFYFAWLGFYTSMLIPASLVGLLCFIYGVMTIDHDVPTKEICNKSLDHLPMCPLCNVKECEFWHLSDNCTYSKISYLFDNPATVLFTIFMCLWITVYLEMWKRYSSRITYKWDLSEIDTFEEYPRPEYLAHLTKAEKKKLNIITKMYEPYIPFWKKKLPYTILSSGIVLLLILLALASLLGVIAYRVSVRAALSQNVHLVRYSSLLTSSTAAFINLVCILIFNQIYGYIALYLTELEMPRTQTDFDNSLTLKMYLLQFVNYYSSIFYIAFFKGRFVSHPGEINNNSRFTLITQEECGTGGCLVELAIQLAIIMVGKQALNSVMEMVDPWLEWFLKIWKLKKKNQTYSDIKQYESDYLLANWTPEALFYEYLEMVLQFGFVTIFVAAFPLAPLFALLNNILEIRLDARKMLTSLKRPVAHRVKSIGVWYRILDSICKLSVITNCFVIAFTSDFIPRMYFYYKHATFNNYTNSTLSYFNASEIVGGNKEKYYKNMTQPMLCMYQGYRNPPHHDKPYDSTHYSWEILAIRLAFIVIFENLIATTTMFLRWLIPDVPKALKRQVRQHTYLTNELIMQQEIKRAKQNIH